MAAAMAGLALVLVGTGGAWAQQPDAGPQAAPAAGDGGDQPVSQRYRFSERYGANEDPGRPETLVEYQVAAIETIRIEVEQAEGAPNRQEWTYRTVYTERPMKVGRLGELVDAVRRYDKFQLTAPRALDAGMTSMFRDLKFWYHLGPSAVPELICMTPDRTIRQQEYDFIVHQAILPRLMEALPPPARPVRARDSWPISRKAALMLMDDVPDKGAFDLEGTLVDVRKEGQGTALTAMIEISGKLDLEQGPGSVRARISFVFEPTAPAPAADPKAAAPAGARPARDPGIVDARGYIAKIHMLRRMMVPIDKAGRLQQITTRELLLGRRPSVARAAPGAGEVAALMVPAAPPTADENNSWLLYDDPQGRFHFRHPQELVVVESNLNDLQLQYVHRDGKADTLVVAAVPKEADPVADRQWTDPQTFVQNLRKVASHKELTVVKDQVGWLPDQDWAPLKRKVFRYEAALEAKTLARLYMDAYLILFTRGNRFHVQAQTNRDDHRPFRDQAEKVIKSLELGPSTPGMVPTPVPTPVPKPGGPPAATRPTPSRPGPPPVPSSGRARP